MVCSKIVKKMLFFLSLAPFFDCGVLLASKRELRPRQIPPMWEGTGSLPVPERAALSDQLISPVRIRKTPDSPSTPQEPAKRLIIEKETPILNKRAQVVAAFISPVSRTTTLTNYCKGMINALNVDDLQGFSNKFQDFKARFAYDIVPKKGETDTVSNRVLFYKALFGKMFAEFPNAVITSTDSGVESLITTEQDKNYVLRFHVTQAPANPRDSLKFPKYRKTSGILFHQNLPENQYQIKVDQVSWKDVERLPVLEPIFYDQETPSRQMLEMLDQEDIDAAGFNTQLTAFFSGIPPELIVKRENYFQMLFFAMLTFLRSDTVAAEIHHEEGRSDIVIKGQNNIVVVEWKLNEKRVQVALDQITNRHYCDEYREQALNNGQKIFKMGINVRVDKSSNQFLATETVVEPYEPTYRKIEQLYAP